MNPWLLLLLGWLTAAIVMMASGAGRLRSGDASMVDVSWSICVGLLAVAYAFFNDGYLPRRIIVGVLAGLWSLRLATYLVRRIRRLPEDGRYQSLRSRRGAMAPSESSSSSFRSRHSGAFCSRTRCCWRPGTNRPARRSRSRGCLLWLVSVAGETLADRQLWNFRQDAGNRGRVCRHGLWRYSRHPNYFFEWLHWWCYVLLGWHAPWGWLTLGGPLIMLWFLFKITGIPPTEEQALRSRGDAYREYQRPDERLLPLAAETTGDFRCLVSPTWPCRPPRRAGFPTRCSGWASAASAPSCAQR